MAIYKSNLPSSSRDSQYSASNDIPDVSSMSLALQKHNDKKNLEEETTKQSVKRFCVLPNCGKEVFPIRKCGGHGGGGGGGCGKGPEDASDAKLGQGENTVLLNALGPKLVEGEYYVDDSEASEESLPEIALKNEDLQLALIANLMDQGLLVIDYDPNSQTLTISLKCTYEELSEEEQVALQQFMLAIMTAFEDVQATYDLSDDCMKIGRDAQKNIISLGIRMPTPALFKLFTEQLTTNNGTALALTSPNPSKANSVPQQAEAEEYRSPFNPTPFPNPFADTPY